MRKEKTLLVLGIWVVILPFLGFPDTWRKVLFVLTGCALMYLSYILYLEARMRIPKKNSSSQTFVDNIPDR